MVFVIIGFGIVIGLLLVYGFVLFFKLMVNKKNVVFFVFGFVLVVYLKVFVIGVVIFVVCLVLILIGYVMFKNDNGLKNLNIELVFVNDGGINYEDEEFWCINKKRFNESFLVFVYDGMVMELWMII